MKKWIARWIGRPGADARPEIVELPEHPGAGPGNVELPEDHAASESEGHSAEVGIVFYRWLTGAGELDALPDTEKMILEELARLAQSPDAGAHLVPRVPAVIPQLLRSLRDDHISTSELARQLAQDVVLVAEVIREANSSYYRPAMPIRTVESAVMLLGQNGMRMLLARVSFRPIIGMQPGRFARQIAPRAWSLSEKCATAASRLSPAMGANPSEAYLAGMMQNVGLIVAFRLIDQIIADDVLPQSDQFCSALLSYARIFSSRIAGQWDFPVTVSDAIEHAGTPGAPPLAGVLAVSDRISKLRMLVDAGQFRANDPFVLEGLDHAALACFKNLNFEQEVD